MHYYIDLVLAWEERHIILLNKQHRLYYSVDYNLINAGMCNFICIKHME